MSFANGRFRSDLTEDENNPRSYSDQKAKMLGTFFDELVNEPRQLNQDCNTNNNQCVILRFQNGTCECKKYICKQSDGGTNCIYTGPRKTSSTDFIYELSKMLDVMKQFN